METDRDTRESIETAVARRFSSKRLPGSARVLIAEDDEEMRRLLCEAFVFEGYRVAAVGSGLELFDTLRRSRDTGMEPAIVVSDIRMPGLTGLDVLNRIRGWGCKMPVILITAFGDEETLAVASRMGATAVFNKPFDIDDLRTAVAYFLEDERPEKGGKPPLAGT